MGDEASSKVEENPSMDYKGSFTTLVLIAEPREFSSSLVITSTKSRGLSEYLYI